MTLEWIDTSPDIHASARRLAELAHRIDARLVSDPGWPALMASIRRAEAAGYDTDTRLPKLARGSGGLPDRHPARELHFRLLGDHPAAAGSPSGRPAGPTDRNR